MVTKTATVPCQLNLQYGVSVPVNSTSCLVAPSPELALVQAYKQKHSLSYWNGDLQIQDLQLIYQMYMQLVKANQVM